MENWAAGADTRLHTHASRIASRLTQGAGALSMRMLGGGPKVVSALCLGKERGNHARGSYEPADSFSPAGAQSAIAKHHARDSLPRPRESPNLNTLRQRR